MTEQKARWCWRGIIPGVTVDHHIVGEVNDEAGFIEDMIDMAMKQRDTSTVSYWGSKLEAIIG